MTDDLDDDSGSGESGFDDWLRDTDPPGELSVPEGAWETAVGTAFDPSYELDTDLTAASGPDPADEEFDGEVSAESDLAGDDPIGDDFGDTSDDVFGDDGDPVVNPVEDGTFDDDF
ncbi:hypothetical protein WDY80_04915 [Gordonia hongkongensis]|uniref:hypothetical protein n=1 Tax=Gordonia hongkongensis TaxID=1701090 RepID=UPI0030D23F01